ncbi:hypothetical protein ACWDPI_34535, partial [Streptomyces zhihengii]
KEMDLLVEEGVTSFKLFMAYPGVFYSDDGQIRPLRSCCLTPCLPFPSADQGVWPTRGLA